MANIFTDQAQERFKKSDAFFGKAQALLQDDLVARTVLADAVSAIKNMLQGYLLTRISAAAPDATRQQWQEIAASNRMPDLVRACADAGLNIRDLARDIYHLNDARNVRMHDDPHSRVDATQARQALQLARTVAQRVNNGIRRGPGAVPLPRAATSIASLASERAAAPAARASAAASSAPRTLADGRASQEHTAAPSAAAAEAPEAATAGADGRTSGEEVGATTSDDEPAAADSAEYPAYGARRGAWLARLARRAVGVAALVALGVALGVALAALIASGRAPQWLGFAQPWLTRPHAAGRIATPDITTPSATSGFVAGALVATAPVCHAGRVAFALSNVGTSALPWAVASAGTPTAFALGPTAATQATLAGTLAPGASTTIYAHSATPGTPYSIMAFGPAGTVQLEASAC